MAYKFPGTPSTKAYIEELADFWEIEVLRNPDLPFSTRVIQNALSIELDELNHEGTYSEDDEVLSDLDSVMQEILRRIDSTKQKYPFRLEGTRLILDVSCDEIVATIYIYLLLCTRFNMLKHKVQGNLDGTLLFERLCAVIGKNYWGDNAESMILGTSNSGNFENKVTQCINFIGEGNCFVNRNNNDPTKNDDGIDIVLVKHFSDQRPSKLIGLGQCKTGTDWHKTINKSKMVDFCSTWFRDNPVFEPIPIAFISDTLYHQFNDYSNSKGCLMFNRFRLMEYLPKVIEQPLKDQIQSWVSNAVEYIKNPI
jgi:hypothetical protein